MKKLFLIILVLAGIACRAAGPWFDASEDVRSRALAFAALYEQEDTEYWWGGQDPLRVIRIDCSGLVVMCYKYALVDTGCELPFSDATARDMYATYTRETASPRAGDLVFMGSADETAITHVALFKEKKDGMVYFIDATSKPADGGYPEVDGVSERRYPEDDPRFKSFGIMQLRRSW